MKALFGYVATAILATSIVTAAAPVKTPANGGRETELPYYPPYMSHFSYPLLSGIYPILPPVGPNASVFNNAPAQTEIELAEESSSQNHSEFRNEK